MIEITAPISPQPMRRVERDIIIGKAHQPVYFESPNPILQDCNEAWLACALLPAMRRHHDITLHGDFSARLGDTLPAIIRLYHSWESSLRTVKVNTGPLRATEPKHTGRVAAFFSGGVDSFYTLLENLDTLTDLVFVHGFDIRLGEAVLYQQASAAVHQVAEAFGLNVIEIRTNVRKLLNPHVSWGGMGHGAPMFAIAHLLSLQVDRILIPSAMDFEHLLPLGAHPELDPLWSSEQVEIIHHGCEATRMQKVERLTQSEVALKHLRVCYCHPNGSINCGKCKKCMMTMLHLHVLGRLEDSATFPPTITPDDISNLQDPKSVATHIFYNEILETLEDRPQDKELVEAIHDYLARPDTSSPVRQFFRRIERTIRHLVKNPYR